MKEGQFTLVEQRPLAPSVFEMRLEGDVSAITTPGQFVNLALPGFTLRRPISVCDVRRGEPGVLTLIYKVVGEGTRAMSGMQPGITLDVLSGLGNGYNVDAAGARPILFGGGVGTPPLYWLARELRARELPVCVVLGFNTAAEVFYTDEFSALGCEVRVCTMDGSSGTKGFVTDALAQMEGAGALFTHFYACGPKPMLRAVCAKTGFPGEVSMEERMGCGFGACMGCTLVTAKGPKRVCKDGPVFAKEDVLW